MNIQHLQYVVEVARTGSITQAAENLFMGQPNLSKSIRDLENSLGIKIFRRTSRGVVPTPEGEEFLHYARSIIRQVEKVEALYREERPTQAHFSLVATPSLYTSVAFARFTAKLLNDENNAALSVALRETFRNNALELVASGEYDAGLLRCRLDEEESLLTTIRRLDLNVTPMWLYQLSIMMSPKHPLATAPVITQEMLAPYPRIILSSNPASRFCLFENEVGIPPNDRIYIRASSRESGRELLTTIPQTYVPAAPLPAEIVSTYGLTIHPLEGNLCRYRDLFVTRHNSPTNRLEKLLTQELYSLQSGT